MFILIVGGGKVGSYLTRALLDRKSEVVVVEKDERKAKNLERLIGQQVTVVGDGCDPKVLRAAGVERADIVVADTGDDEDNLVVVLLSKRISKARCIARVNNPRNRRIFESLDTGEPVTVISSTEIILDVLNEHVSAAGYGAVLETMHLFGKGNLHLTKMSVAAVSAVVGKEIGEIELPNDTVLVAIEREGEEIVVPSGHTRLQAGDRVIAVVKNGARERLAQMLGAGG